MVSASALIVPGSTAISRLMAAPARAIKLCEFYAPNRQKNKSEIARLNRTRREARFEAIDHGSSL